MKHINIRLPWECFILILAISLITSAGCERESGSVTKAGHGIEGLAPVGSGIITNASGGDFMSYNLYALVEPPGGSENDFLLVLRNTSSKFIDFQEATVDKFELKDSKGKQAKLALHSIPRSIAYGEATSLHISAIDFTNAAYPLALTFKADLGIPVFLSVSNIVR